MVRKMASRQQRPLQEETLQGWSFWRSQQKNLLVLLSSQHALGLQAHRNADHGCPGWRGWSPPPPPPPQRKNRRSHVLTGGFCSR